MFHRIFLYSFPLLSPLFFCSCDPVAPNTPITQSQCLAITQITEHPSLNKIRQGILDELSQEITRDHLRIVYSAAQGNLVLAAQIATKFASLDPRCIVAITTPSAQTVAMATKSLKIPVVFSALSTPVESGIVSNIEKPGGYITGTIDLPSPQKQLELIIKCVGIRPSALKLGLLYNPAETNSHHQVARIKAEAQRRHIEIVESVVHSSSDVFARAQFLASQGIQALLIPNDNTVVSALESLLKVMMPAEIPVFTSDPDSVERGAAAAVANDQYEVGRATGQMVREILKGKYPGNIPVKQVQASKIFINKKLSSVLESLS